MSEATTGWRAAIGYPDETGRLLAQCWCRDGYVWVPADEIRAGRTGTCRRPTCHAPMSAAVVTDEDEEEWKAALRRAGLPRVR